MTLDDLLPYLGCSEQNVELAKLLAGVGFDIAVMPGRAQKNFGLGFCELSDLGIELAFNFHTDFKERYGLPRDAGKAIFSGIFAYDNPSKKRRAYIGPIPFSRGPIHARADALREFGPPLRIETEDGIVEWDQWMKEGLQVRTTYRDDGSLSNLMVSIPFK